jgi:large subunit ribosomal protein L11
MAKPIKTVIKLQAKAGQANPANVGTALGPHGLNIMDFCSSFNEQTKDKGNMVIPAEITVYEDRSFDFILKTPPAAMLIKQSLKLEKASGVPNKEKVGKLSKAQLEEIAKIKMPDLSANDIEAAMKIVAGTARSMGVEVEK